MRLSTYGQVVLNIQARLVSKFAIGRERVRIVFPQDGGPGQGPPHHADISFALAVHKPISVTTTSDGSGRLLLRVRRLIEVKVYVRSLLDDGDEKELWLTQADIGYFNVEGRVLEYLHDYIPMSGEDWMTLEPIKFQNGTDVVSLTKDWEGWATSSLFFSTDYAVETSTTEGL